MLDRCLFIEGIFELINTILHQSVALFPSIELCVCRGRVHIHRFLCDWFELKCNTKKKKNKDISFNYVTIMVESITLNAMDHTPMKDFYRDKVIFLTGATGVLGELFVEKLLR